MVSTKRTYYPQLDSLRAIGWLAVCIVHWLHEYSFVEFMHIGNMSLDYFFVLSGFLITGILLRYRSKSNFGKAYKVFMLRRVLRIFPLYYLVIILATIFNNGDIRDAILYNLTYTSNFYFISINRWTALFSHIWSLAVEEQFYLIWPFVIMLLPRKHLLKALFLVVLVGVGSRAYLYFSGAGAIAIKVATLSCFDAFGIGGILAFLFKERKQELTSIVSHSLTPWITGLLLIATGLSHHFSETLWASQILTRLATCLFCFWVIGYSVLFGFKGIVGKILDNTWLTYLGTISYGLYLFHNFVPGFLLGVKFPEHPLARFFLYLVANVIISIVAFKLVETPFNKLKKKFTIT